MTNGEALYVLATNKHLFPALPRSQAESASAVKVAARRAARCSDTIPPWPGMPRVRACVPPPPAEQLRTAAASRSFNAARLLESAGCLPDWLALSPAQVPSIRGETRWCLLRLSAFGKKHRHEVELLESCKSNFGGKRIL